jgi:hypothetical protein
MMAQKPKARTGQQDDQHGARRPDNLFFIFHALYI